MLKFILYLISAIIAAVLFYKFGIYDQAEIPQKITNALTLIALYKICEHEEKRGD